MSILEQELFGLLDSFSSNEHVAYQNLIDQGHRHETIDYADKEGYILSVGEQENIGGKYIITKYGK